MLRLQLSCRSTSVKDVSIWSIANPHVSLAFERASAGLLCLDCWVDVTALDENNAIQDVCKRGFVMPESGDGLPFLTGNIRFDADGPGTLWLSGYEASGVSHCPHYALL